MNLCFCLMKVSPYVATMSSLAILIPLTKFKMAKITPILTKTDMSISSFSLCSMHCFQILNYKLNCFPDPLPPNVAILAKSLWLILFKSLISIKKKLWNVWLRYIEFASAEYFPSYTRFSTSTTTGFYKSLSIFISSMISKQSFFSVMWNIGSVIKLWSK